MATNVSTRSVVPDRVDEASRGRAPTGPAALPMGGMRARIPHAMAEHPSLLPKPPPRGVDLPCDDGEPLETQRHRDQMNLLIDSLGDAWRDRDDFYVAGNMFLYFSETQAKRNDFRGPDVFVVLDTEKHERRSWVVWEEDGRTPDVIVEITSPKTERVDRGEKMRVYARVLRVPAYFIYDPFTARLDGYELDPKTRSYVALAPDEHGYLPCAPLGLRVGVLPGRFGIGGGEGVPWLRWIGPDGEPFLHPNERAELERERARKEAERAQKEAERAQREAERADALAAKIAEYERRFGKLD